MQRGEPYRVVIAERRPLYATAISAGVDASYDLAVVSTVHTTDEVIEGARRLEPDIIVLDAILPPGGGVGACTRLKDGSVPPAVMIVDDVARPGVLLEAIEADADGYTTRDVSLAGFIMALQAIGRGEVSVPRAMQAPLIRGLRSRQRERERISLLYHRLTRREREVLDLLADGLNTEKAADVLSISPQTIRTHIQNSLSKLEVHSRLEAAALVRRYRSRRSTTNRPG